MKIPTRRYALLGLLLFFFTSTLEAQTGRGLGEPFTLDSLSSSNSGYYIPREVSSPTLLQAIADAPSIESQLLGYYASGGIDTPSGRSLLLPWLMMPRPWALPPKQLLHLPPLSITVNQAKLLQLVSDASPSPTDYRKEAGLSLLGQFLASTLKSHPKYFTDKQLTLPPSLALTTPSGGSVERALEGYTAATKPTPIYISEKRDYSELRERKWIPQLESAIQFSQNSVSDNWYKGGASNLNLYMRNYFALSYIKDRVLWKNEIESKLSVYNAEKDTVHRYRIADDLLRLRTNYGIRAFNKIYYTLDAELRTQLLSSYRENKTSLQSDFLSPFTVNIGLGLKFDYKKKSTKVYGRSVSFSINVAPLSYTYRGTVRQSIELARHGLAPDQLWYQRFGSTIRAAWEWKVNMNLTWTSRLFFNTSYQAIEAEWENTLDMALTRYFSTRFNLNLRYDDAVRPTKAWNRHLQYNELLSFGFNYRL